MGCFKIRTNYPPIPRFDTEDSADSFRLKLKVCWLDNCCKCDNRKAEWTFFVNENIVLTLPFAALETGINIGIGSTYEELILPNGFDDLVDFLEYNGNDIESGDFIKIEVHALNCRNIQSANPAIFELIYGGDTDENSDWKTTSDETWETLDGEAFEHF